MIILIFFAGVAVAALAYYSNKKLLYTQTPGETTRGMYAACFILALALAALNFSKLHISAAVMALGFVMAAAAWFSNRAAQHGLAKTFIFLPLNSGLAVILAILFLGEWRLFNIGTWPGKLYLGGVVLSLSVALVLGFVTKIKRTDENRLWLKNLLAYCAVAGVINFLIKYTAISGVPILDYLVSWYAGTFLGAWVPFFLISNAKLRRPSRQEIYFYVLLGAATLAAMAASYWLLIRVSAAAILSLQTICYTASGVLLGLYVFREKEGMEKREWLALGAGAIGAIMLIEGLYLK